MTKSAGHYSPRLMSQRLRAPPPSRSPSDMSSSSSRLSPISCDVAFRLSVGVGNSGNDGGDCGDVSSPDRSNSAVPPPATHTCTKTQWWAQRRPSSPQRLFLAHLLALERLAERCCHWRSRPSPAACTGWWPASGCRWPAGSPLQGGREGRRRSSGIRTEMKREEDEEENDK